MKRSSLSLLPVRPSILHAIFFLALIQVNGMAHAAAPAGMQAAPGSQLSHASESLSGAVGIVLAGAVSTVGASGELVLASVETVADGTVIVLKGASDGASATVRLSAEAGAGLSGAVGGAVTVSATGAGYLLLLAGKTIAFVPNEIGKTLLFRSRVES